jgi:hypothetical protein
MLVLLSTTDQTVAALLLAVGKTRMRLAVPGRSDTLELELVDGEWMGDDGREVTIESVVQSGEFDMARLGYELFPRTHSALN